MSGTSALADGVAAGSIVCVYWWRMDGVMVLVHDGVPGLGQRMLVYVTKVLRKREPARP